MPNDLPLTGRVIRPDQPAYADARLNYNQRFNLAPGTIVFCQRVIDVINAVKWARAQRLPLRVRSGRHSYEAFSNVDQGVVIDVNEMEGVYIDKERGRAIVLAGMELMPLYEALGAEGLTVPAGSCASVGITGAALGGGYGLLARWQGLTCDNLLEVEMVNAAGELLYADATHNADLLWALRGGGGGNFGIVTSLSLRTYAIGNVTIYSVTWKAADFAAVVKAWQVWAPTTDDRLTSVLKLRTPNVSTPIMSLGQFVGTEAELRPLLDPLLKTGSPFNISIQTVPYLEAARIFAGLQPNYPKWMTHWHGSQTKFKGTSDFAATLFDDAAIATLLKNLQQSPSANNLVQLDSYGGAINRITPEATAFCHRTAKFNLQYQAYWSDAKDQPAALKWIDACRTSMQPYVTGGAYVNYCDRALPNWLQAYYGENLTKLRQIKQKYDPENFFTYDQSIPPAAP